eukprot:TRINITY_DN21819_c0_g1_i1.p1 TRINITY_DN21819_c0_g1~~TRINITY_DN21819_c0_g1_i1.p1  ORF type:complete len:379 (-),score=105.85 TRINITY_DN21819_c0_g1_i1:173-1309(-)
MVDLEPGWRVPLQPEDGEEAAAEGPNAGGAACGPGAAEAADAAANSPQKCNLIQGKEGEGGSCEYPVTLQFSGRDERLLVWRHRPYFVLKTQKYVEPHHRSQQSPGGKGEGGGVADDPGHGHGSQPLSPSGATRKDSASPKPKRMLLQLPNLQPSGSAPELTRQVSDASSFGGDIFSLQRTLSQVSASEQPIQRFRVQRRRSSIPDVTEGFRRTVTDQGLSSGAAFGDPGHIRKKQKALKRQDTDVSGAIAMSYLIGQDLSPKELRFVARNMSRPCPKGEGTKKGDSLEAVLQRRREDQAAEAEGGSRRRMPKLPASTSDLLRGRKPAAIERLVHASKESSLKAVRPFDGNSFYELTRQRLDSIQLPTMTAGESVIPH